MHPFVPGDLVICIDDKPLPERIIRIGEPWVEAGRAYRVRSVSICGDLRGVELEDLAHWPPAVGWHAWRFIKIEPAEEDFSRQIRRLREPLDA